jgi:hypothetical protein
MYLDELPSARVTEMRRTGTLTPDVASVAVAVQGDDGTTFSTEVRVVGFACALAASSSNSYADVAASALKSFDCMRAGSCADGSSLLCEGKPAVRRAQHRIERLKAMRFHGGPVTQRPGRTMERREELMAALRRSKLDPHSAQFRCEVVATIACGIMIPHTCDAGDASLSSCQDAEVTRTAAFFSMNLLASAYRA